MSIKTYVITGPTASGKSWFAHELARRINGIIINCDSVQIYRGIENISASPFAGRALTPDIDGVPYKLFSILPLSSQISVSEYLSLAQTEYNAACVEKRPVIFVGGTGYYINAILQGMSPMPDISDACRQRARDLVQNDFNAAREMLPPEFTATDPQRVSRALEVFFETGKHITEFQSMSRIGAIAPDAIRVLINPDSEILRKRIAARIPEMLSGGAEQEAHAIIESGWDASRAIGASQLVDYIFGKITYQECIENWITKTNQYAKRQRTWFRTQYNADIEIKHIPSEQDLLLLQ